MANTIPLSKDFNISTGVVSAAGTAVASNGLMLTTSTALPSISVQYYYQLQEVSAVYGVDSDEYKCAEVYFGGYSDSSLKPAALLVAGIPSAATSGVLTGGSLSGVTMATINALGSGTITLSVDGVSQTSSTIDLSSSSSQSDVATAIQAALTGVVVSWNSTTNRFVITSATTGSSSSVSAATTGSLSTGLKLTSAAGASSVNGSATLSLTELMDNIKNQTQNWFAFACAQNLTDDQKVELATWEVAQNRRFSYCMNDQSLDTLVTNSTTALYPNRVKSLGDGIWPIYGAPEFAFQGVTYYACTDFTVTKGRITAKLREFSTLTPNVTTLSQAEALESNGYSYYGAYSENTTLPNYLADGSVSGDYLWADSYQNQYWIKSSLITSLANIFLNNQSYSYNAAGYASVQSAIIDPMANAVDYGAIQQGITLDSSQTTIVKNAVGKDVTEQLYTNGWYFYIPTQPGANRIARKLTGCVLYYVDGEMIQSISMQSTAVL